MSQRHKAKNNSRKNGNVRRKRGVRPEQGIYSGDQSSQLILSKRYRIVPPAYITNLVFQSTNHNPLNNAGITYASVRFRPTSAYDVDPSIGGTSMPGFNELAALYGKYRVLRWKMSATIVNLELDNGLNFIVFPSNFDLGNNYSQVQSQFGNSFAKYTYVAPKGGMDRKTINTGWLSARSIVGSDSVYVDDDYASNVNTSPTNNSYMNVAIWTGNSVPLSNGANLLVVITLEVRFTETLHNVTQPDPPELHPELQVTTPSIVPIIQHNTINTTIMRAVPQAPIGRQRPC